MAIENHRLHIKHVQVVNGISQLSDSLKGPFFAPLEHTSVTIGNFDGVHLGHRSLLERVLQKRVPGGAAVVMTFSPHPSEVLRPERKVKKLFSFDDQLQQLRTLGFDVVIVEPFTLEFAKVSAQDFFDKWLIQPLSPQALTVGHDFAFGAGREGNHSFMEAACRQTGVSFERVEPFVQGGEPISSTRIRGLLREGQVAEVEALLGRPFYIRGAVEPGAGRGRRVGFRTANIDTVSEVGLANGVYAGVAEIDGKRYEAVSNFGRRPTFESDGRVKLEVHLLDTEMDLYGVSLDFHFKHHLRSEKKFSSIDSLIAQIQEDTARARELLSNQRNETDE